MVVSGADFLNPLVNLWNSFVLIIPGLIAGLILAVVGYVIAYVIGRALKLVLVKARIDQKIEHAKISKAIGYVKLSSLLGDIAKWYIFIIFLQAAVSLLDLGTLSNILGIFVSWMPNLIAAILVVIFGLLVAQLVRVKIEEHAKTSLAKVASNILMGVVVAIVIIIALDQIGIEVEILKNLLLLTTGSLAVGIALAIGLSFGLGNKKEANDMLRNLKKRL